jgi:hypothetical protein
VAGLLVGIVLIVAGGVLAIGGIGLCMSGVYAGFLWVFHGSVFWAGLVTGLITLLIAGVVLCVGKVVTRG